MMINVYIKGVGAQIQNVQSLGLTNSWFRRPDHQVFSSKAKTENPKIIPNWYHVFLSQRQQLCLLRFFVSRNPPAPSNLQFGSAELDTSFKWIGVWSRFKMKQFKSRGFMFCLLENLKSLKNCKMAIWLVSKTLVALGFLKPTRWSLPNGKNTVRFSEYNKMTNWPMMPQDRAPSDNVTPDGSEATSWKVVIV